MSKAGKRLIAAAKEVASIARAGGGMKYTAEDFEAAYRAARQTEAESSVPFYYDDIAFTAIRIAQRFVDLARRGAVDELTIRKVLEFEHAEELLARKALTDPPEEKA